jgi:carbamoyltransferase
MKIIIGINAYHADSSACIIIDGKLVAAVEEERINRLKHFSGYPIESIKECLKIANKESTEITDVAFNTKPFSNLIPKTSFFLRNNFLKKNYSTSRLIRKINIKKKLLNEFDLNKHVKFHFIEHHLAHIASAFYPSGFKNCTGLSIDGSGDFVSCAIAECQNKEIIIKKKIFFPHSLGIFYHGMTQFLGFHQYGEEYKMMGLASYGKPKYFNKIIENLFKTDSNDFFELNLEYFNHHKPGYKYIANDNLQIDQIFNEKLTELFFDEKKNEKDHEIFKMNFASSVQKVYEFFFNKIITDISLNTNSNKLVFSGGCALNSTANKVLTENKEYFEDVYINYAPGDNGGAIGAALVVGNKYFDKIENLKTPYTGVEFSNNDVEQVLKNSSYKNKFSYKLIENDKIFYQTVARLIAQGNVIGWFQGKMEFGPRALGNRSILADPSNPKMKEIINLKIKRRESFRPFAPVVLKGFQSEWFESNFENLYMSSVTQVKNNKQSLVPAITHIDGTARIQSVDKLTNKKLTYLIEEFEKLTKIPILLNTSFNENEPIVRKPEEALNCILRNDLEYLIINNFIVQKII